MPNTDRGAKAWQEERSKRFGEAVAARRSVLGLTAVELSARTKSIGYPMTRSTIARIEGNHRAGKVDLAEVVTLAAALNIAPILLLFPDLIDGNVRVLPDREMPSYGALAWFTGRALSPFPAGSHLDEQQTQDQIDYYESLAPLRHSRRVGRHRRWLNEQIQHRDEGKATSSQVIEAKIELDGAKQEARQAGLQVVNDNDSMPAVSDDA